MKKLTTILLILLVVDALLIVSGEFFWLFDLSRNYFVQSFMLAITCLVMLIVQGRFAFAAAAFALAVYIGWPLHTMIPYTHAATGDAVSFSVLEANVNFENTRYGSLARQVLGEAPDIVVMHEVSQEWIDAIREATDVYPYEITAFSHTYRGMVILSRHPFSDVDRIELSDEESPILVAQIPELDTTLLAVHTLSPVSAVWSLKRDRMLQYVGEMVDATEGRVLVVGDLNSTIHTTSFQGMLEESGLQDGRRGFGWKPSWMYGTPLAAAIDHILYRGDISVDDFRVLGDVGSDHRPIIAHVRSSS